MPPPSEQAAHDLLAFYAEAGVDALVGEVPVDRFAAADPAPTTPAPAPAGEPRRPVSAPAVRPGTPVVAPDEAAMAARAAARSAATLEELRAILDKFDGCALKTTAKQMVFGDGNPQARIMFVGEAPGRDEDIEGVPFVGRSGKLLNLMIKAIGLARADTYITNIIPWRPPGNRDPTPQESVICLPFIQRHIELVNPDILVCLGKPSSQTLLNIKDGILKSRGRWYSYAMPARQIRAMVTLHPAYLLRQPNQKRLAWRDFLAIQRELASTQA
ncbi:MAG: uracil-DNA glycosylase [Rhizobiales bacterium]|nr:uracil-DNA glycosylase [Hyphomicrobiales bacterium]OJY44871.1 MAG: uracil-DNA glycosylase [Rhizobiales bacterium 64-17]